MLVLFLTGWGSSLPAQEADSLQTPIINLDSIQEKPRKGFLAKNYPDPKKALLLSFILPGSGQIYNKKWWKLPIVYGALGTMLYIEFFNINQYTALRDNYRFLVDDDPNTNPTEEPYTSLDANSMKFYRDESRRSLEQSSLFLGLTYILVATDAFVDAHLSTFDVSDDLSLRPTAIPTATGQPAFGFGLRVTLDRPNPLTRP